MLESDVDITQLLNQDVTITSINNELNFDEESAILRCEFSGEQLTIIWTYSTGFSVPVFINDCRVLSYIENELIKMTKFNGYSCGSEPKGLVQTACKH